MKRLKSSILILVMLSPLASFGAELDGNNLIVACGAAVSGLDHLVDPDYKVTRAESWQMGYCDGLVHGVSQLLIADKKITLPENWNLGQFDRVVHKYLRDHPEELSDIDTALVIRALEKAFPVQPVNSKFDPNKPYESAPEKK